jgi:membrane protein implicated in regulation of membrane protease activity
VKNTEGATAIMAPFSGTSRVAGDSRWLALVVLCAGMLMIVLDATIVNVALPSIRRSGLLAASVAEPAALTDGYRLSFAIGAALVLVALVVAATVMRRAEGAEREAMQEHDQPLGDAVLPAARVR